ncbi:MAG: CHAT domain-containing protein [Verrucomicrobiota bacterium]
MSKSMSYLLELIDGVFAHSTPHPYASSKSKVQSSKSLVMGNPDFDLDLTRSRQREEAEISHSKDDNTTAVRTSAATGSLSRLFRGFKFTPLPSAAEEARSVAKLLGDDAVLKLDGAAREAELKTVVSSRVLHLATHGFFLSDQKFRETDSMGDLLLAGNNFTARRRLALPINDWENPLVRCERVDDGIHASLAFRRAPCESLARGAAVVVALE